MGVSAWIALVWELIKLFPEVVAWVKSHPFASKKDAVMAFKHSTREMMDSGVGIPPELKREA